MLGCFVSKSPPCNPDGPVEDVQDSFQTQGAEMFEVAAHGEAAPVDAWSDLPEVDHRP